MNKQPIAMRSILNPNYLKDVLESQYNLGPWLSCVYWLRGLNDTYRIQTDTDTYILRIYRTEVTEDDVIYELSVLAQLKDILHHSTHADIAEPICKINNMAYSVLRAPEGARMAVILRYIDGVENILNDEESCYIFGRSAAVIHNALDQIVVPKERSSLDMGALIWKPLENIIQYIGEDHPEVAFLKAYADALSQRVKSISSQGLDWGLCHGDMHGNNNAFQQGQSFVHYDFEWVATGWRAYDLAQVRIRKRQSEDRKDLLWQRLLEGYRSKRPLSVGDEEAVEVFVLVRRFWVMALDVMFIPSDAGALDYGDDWLNEFIEEFRNNVIGSSICTDNF
ncbi:phosphotransferase [Paenibacillus sp. UMB7766-LJ446]|uniref:phosphotransferase n=1 Tax=Paenibacillus sp. UMB7766-LJ446 TaxID=3046313 RepID=UPI002550DB9B|nr:phosphotransferase [Paenibacillus sp. UMB7766-LJ446]MDK8191929.1 phosphotransferase [Paenibacillus sp. UMB7766-LJ446]